MPPHEDDLTAFNTAFNRQFTEDYEGTRTPSSDEMSDIAYMPAWQKSNHIRLKLMEHLAGGSAPEAPTTKDNFYMMPGSAIRGYMTRKQPQVRFDGLQNQAAMEEMV